MHDGQDTMSDELRILRRNLIDLIWSDETIAQERSYQNQLAMYDYNHGVNESIDMLDEMLGDDRDR